MTRDEAVNTLMKYQGDHDPERSGHWIDALNALGILKLDEPKSAMDKFAEALMADGYTKEGGTWWAVNRALDRAQLRIVEK